MRSNAPHILDYFTLSINPGRFYESHGESCVYALMSKATVRLHARCDLSCAIRILAYVIE
jgi:hypothetical protein